MLQILIKFIFNVVDTIVSAMQKSAGKKLHPRSLAFLSLCVDDTFFQFILFLFSAHIGLFHPVSFFKPF